MIGTAVGAGVGAAVGVANEAWEYFSADDEVAVPSTDIGQISSPATSKDKSSTVLNSDVIVNVEISPDMVETNVDNNGDQYMDSNNSFGLTGGA